MMLTFLFVKLPRLLWLWRDARQALYVQNGARFH